MFILLLSQSVQSLSYVWLPATPSTPWTGLPIHHLTPGACSDSCSLSWWCHPTISSSVIPFSSCLQSFPASGSFPMSQFFTSGGQSIGASDSASVLPMNTQDWFPLGWTGLISLQSTGLSRVFSNTTVQKHQFFGAQLSLWSSSYIHTWLLKNPLSEQLRNPRKGVLVLNNSPWIHFWHQPSPWVWTLQQVHFETLHLRKTKPWRAETRETKK